MDNLKDSLHRLTRGMTAAALADHTDPQLVARALTGTDEAAFQAIINRHGPMVYRVCWRVLQHAQDAEDAFQATFLVLAQKLRALREHHSLASWLHGIAHRVALRARAQAAAQRRRDQQASRPDQVVPEEVTWGELRTALDGELRRLPDHWRQPLILCYLEGRTQDEAAAQLGWSKSKLRRYLDKGREVLGRRLASAGITVPAALAAVLLADSLASAAPSAGQVATTVEAAAGLWSGKTAAQVASVQVATLTEGMVRAMFVAKMKTAVMAAVIFLGVIALGGLVTYHIALGQPHAALQHENPPKDNKATAPAQKPDAPKDEQPAPDKSLPGDRLKVVRQMYAQLPSDILGFVEPEKRIIAAQKTGWSLMLLLEDANGKKLEIQLVSKLGANTNAILLPVGLLPPLGPEESAVYGLLLRLAAKPPEKTLAGQREVLDAILKVLDQRFVGAMPMTGNSGQAK
jgi:RNA polymerase sigma factor (sigma-70 family)